MYKSNKSIGLEYEKVCVRSKVFSTILLDNEKKRRSP